MLAVTHAPSPRMASCHRTFAPPAGIDYHTAVRQHAAYCRRLEDTGVDVKKLSVNGAFPDCTFVEDTAIVLDEVAVLASMGIESRRGEPAGIEPELSRYREIRRIESPGTIEGGDVLRVGRTLLVGLSPRTNRAGAARFEGIVGGFGYRVIPVPVRRCLHLKTACTGLPDNRLLVNPSWVEVEALHSFDVVPVPEPEPWAANVALVGETVLMAAAHVRTAELVSGRGFEVQTVDISEFSKAEGGITCLSLFI